KGPIATRVPPSTDELASYIHASGTHARRSPLARAHRLTLSATLFGRLRSVEQELTSAKRFLRDHRPVVAGVAFRDEAVHLGGDRGDDRERRASALRLFEHEARVLARHREGPRRVREVSLEHALGPRRHERTRIERVEERSCFLSRDAERLREREHVGEACRQRHEEEVPEQLYPGRALRLRPEVEELAGHLPERGRERFVA